MKPQHPLEKRFDEEQALSRRGFLRGAGALGLGAGALALGGGSLLAGCGGGGSGVSTVSNTPYTMFISTFLARSVLRFDSTTGQTSTLIQLPENAPNGKNPQTTAGLVLSPDKQNLFVFSPGSDQILMVDPSSGALKQRITGSFVNTSHDGIIGPDGKLYYVNAPSLADKNALDSIEMLDPATGEHLGTFVDTTTAPEVRGPFGITFGPDGDIYTSSVLSFGFNPNTLPFRPDKVARFNGKTGAFKNFAVQQQHLAFTMAFLSNGELMAPSFFFNRLYEYDATKGTLIDAFANVDYPLQVLYGPGGDLFVTSFADQEHVALLTDTSSANDIDAQGAGRVLRLDPKSGQLKSVVASGLPYGGFLAFL